MHSSTIYTSISNARRKNKKQFAVLIDPDKVNAKNVEQLAVFGAENGVDFFFIGGSLMLNNNMDLCIRTIREQCNIPTVLFPGHSVQLSFVADGILFLSLISGRNPDLLIGQHVIAAPLLKKSNLQILPTGYMLIDGGAPTSVTYMSNTVPIPSDKEDIAVCTALAGEMLGLKLIYLDAGSGALFPVNANMIKAVSEAIAVPLIVGGGISTPQDAFCAVEAGADMVVVGNAIERDMVLLKEIAVAVHTYGTSTVIDHVS